MTDLVEIAPPRFDVSLALAYASDDNVTGHRIYRRAACYLHSDAAALLERAIDLAAAQGLKLIIFDGYRPVEGAMGALAAVPGPDLPRGSAAGLAAFAGCRGRFERFGPEDRGGAGHGHRLR